MALNLTLTLLQHYVIITLTLFFLTLLNITLTLFDITLTLVDITVVSLSFVQHCFNITLTLV